jgi:P27 family predicted phage terminase small subunit
MRGRKPVPTALKELRGTDRADRGVANESKPPVPETIPQPPTYFNRWAKKVWREYGQLLLDAGLFTDLDSIAFELLCQAYGRWIDAERHVSEEGPILISDRGNSYQNPYLGVANRAWEQIKKMLGEFGLTPAERTRVAALVDEDDDDLASLLFRLEDAEKT